MPLVSEEYLTRLRRGDSGAYHTLLEECKEDAYSLTRNRDSREEIAQQTAIRILENIDRFDPAQSTFSAWRKLIGKRLWYDMTRKRKRNVITFTDLQTWGYFNANIGNWFPEKRPQNPVDEMIVEEQLQYISHGPNTITPEQRTIIITRHRYGQENSIEATEAALGISQGTIKSSEWHARNRLRERLGEY